jgi:hypothetical protein
MPARLIDIEVEDYHIYQEQPNGPLVFASRFFEPQPSPHRATDQQDAQGRWIVRADGRSEVPYGAAATNCCMALARYVATLPAD